MMVDKDRIQQLADDLADSRYNMDFYDLGEYTQNSIYRDALEAYNNELASKIDAARDRMKERW